MISKIRRRIKAFVINLIGPFVLRYFKDDFEKLMFEGLSMQINGILDCADKARDNGAKIEVHLDPRYLPMGMNIFEGEPTNLLKLVEKDEQKPNI